MYLIEFLSQCVAFISSDIRQRRPPPAIKVGRMPKIRSRGASRLERNCRRGETIDEPFNRRPLVYICKIFSINFVFSRSPIATFISTHESEWKNCVTIFRNSRSRSNRERKVCFLFANIIISECRNNFQWKEKSRRQKDIRCHGKSHRTSERYEGWYCFLSRNMFSLFFLRKISLGVSSCLWHSRLLVKC